MSSAITQLAAIKKNKPTEIPLIISTPTDNSALIRKLVRLVAPHLLYRHCHGAAGATSRHNLGLGIDPAVIRRLFPSILFEVPTTAPTQTPTTTPVTARRKNTSRGQQPH